MELVEPSGFTKGVSMRKIDARDDSKRVPNHDGKASRMPRRGSTTSPPIPWRSIPSATPPSSAGSWTPPRP